MSTNIELTENHTVEQPVENHTVTQPVENHTVTQPVENQILEQLTENQTVVRPTENQTVEQNLKTTCELVETMMNTDGVNDKTKTAIMTTVKLALSSDEYVDLIRQQVKAIISDSVFNQNDLPAVLIIVLQSKAFLRRVLSNGAKIAVNLDLGMLKYIVYAVIHFVMVLEKTNSTSVASLDVTFSPLWDLVAINPQELSADLSTITHKCFPCFYKK